MSEDQVFWSCTRKIRYSSQQSAESCLIAIRRRGFAPMDVYQCPNCDGWHLGNPMRGRRDQWRRFTGERPFI